MTDADQLINDVAERVRQVLSEAEKRAQRIVDQAEAEAHRVRAEAEAESAEKLRVVRAAVQELQAKLDGIAAPAAEVQPGPVTVPEPAPPAVPEPSPEPVPEPSPEPIPEPTPPPDEGTPPAATVEAPAPGGKSSDATAARLVAMNMALDGASREQIEGHLAESYDLPNVGAIVDDVLVLAAR